MVVTNDVHYIREEDAIPHDLLLCIQTGKKVSDKDRMRYEGGQYYLKAEEEMQKVFPYAREAMDNTHKTVSYTHLDVYKRQVVAHGDILNSLVRACLDTDMDLRNFLICPNGCLLYTSRCV